MDHSKKTTYLFSLDFLRVIAILAVILVHQTTTTLQILNHDVTLSPFTLFLNQASRFAVPMLFLISGFVLELNYKNNFSYLTFFKRRALRILIPFIFWSTIYYLISNGLLVYKLWSWNFIYKLFTGDASYHLYFIPTLIIFYLLFPFFHKAIGYLKNPILLSFIFTAQIVISIIDYYFTSLPLHEDLRVATLTFALFILGMGAAHFKENIYVLATKCIKLLVIALPALLFLIFIHVFDMTQRLATNRFIYNQYGPLNYFYTLMLASTMIYFFEKKNYFRKITITLSRLSFFVFFVHVIVLQNVWASFLKNLDNNIYRNFIFDIFVFFFVAIFCFIIAYLIHKIPYASKITG